MIFNVRNIAFIYACLAATASTSPVFANNDPHRTILKPALKKDPHSLNGLHAVKQGDDGGDPHLKKADPHFANSPQALNQEEECKDVTDWQDSLGFGCDYYSKGINCLLFGWAFENDGYTALKACCVCGGGNVGGGDDDDDDDDDDGIVYGLQPSCKSDDSDNYNMCLDLVSLSGEYESWMESFVKATKKWEAIIIGDFPSIASSELEEEIDPELLCTSYPTSIDDLYICAQEASIDGKGGVLGSATPLYARTTGVVNPQTGEEYIIALTGFMQFDSEDIADLQSDGSFDEVVFHEMAHVIGAGTLWVDNGLYDDFSGEYATGTHADDEWKAIGCSGPLPVEQDGGEGTAGGHWDEDCLGDEIMTGALSGSTQPVSRITIATFEDLGYVVDYSKADPFTIADLSVCGSYCPEARRGLRQRERKVKVELDDDGEAAVMRYAKTALTRRHKEVEVAVARHGDRADGIKVFEEINVLYKDAEGRLHEVHVTWDQVKDLHI